jgi:hypothetical protein
MQKKPPAITLAAAALIVATILALIAIGISV